MLAQPSRSSRHRPVMLLWCIVFVSYLPLQPYSAALTGLPPLLSSPFIQSNLAPGTIGCFSYGWLLLVSHSFRICVSSFLRRRCQSFSALFEHFRFRAFCIRPHPVRFKSPLTTQKRHAQYFTPFTAASTLDLDNTSPLYSPTSRRQHLQSRSRLFPAGLAGPA